ncbi:TIM44-like domain-containing protein [Pseudorhodoplanes sp.]|uniref:TIM44-like domain-containing protein n=1 Tax=Pseudorhodoplanes sp. TaxID=1934341 RepID=UPI002B61BB2A|nr:TIM44-like domain-containing protein [Pseudorhodoplanes sp.]HWV51547.1 TIM44-like domain-containing protein [Pseudorhodoplanes sp.]
MPGLWKFRYILSGLAAVALLTATVIDADAARRSGGFGSRGSKTYQAPPPTQTAPNAASPINRSVTQPQAQRPGTVGQTGAAGGFFNRPGFMGGLMAGFLGAGLLGLLFGNGLLGGLSGLAGFLGLLIQVVLVVVVARLLWAWWQRRQQPGYATASGPSLRDNAGYARQSTPQPAYGGGGSGAPMFGGATENLELTGDDFDAFEKRLSDVQAAYSAEDIGKLRALATPEIVSYFAEELNENASRGVVNTVGEVKLLQGDLAEAWREDDKEYATVAMRYSSVDYTTQRATGQVVEGDKQPFERTELWTFMRSRGGDWLLSAIQQA